MSAQRRSHNRQLQNFIILRDTREQAGYSFASLHPVPQVIEATLSTGDYSIHGLQNLITVERKSLPDAFGSFGRDRRRFERELQRMARFEFAAVIIEADWQTILRKPPKYSRLRPRTVHASVIAWQQRYPNIHFWPCPDRDFAERTTYRILERFYLDRLAENDLLFGTKEALCPINSTK